MAECIIYGSVQINGERVGASLKLGEFAPGKELAYDKVIALVSQEQLDEFIMESLPAPFRFDQPEPKKPLFEVMTPEAYNAEFGDTPEIDDDEPDESGFLGPEAPNERGR